MLASFSANTGLTHSQTLMPMIENLLTVETPVERLKESIRQVDETRDLILGMLRQLQSRLEEVRHRQVTMQKELNRLIVATEL